MSSSFQLDNLDELTRQAQALGTEAKPAINSALLAGAKIITAEAKVRVPKSKKHRTNQGQSPRHLADVLKAETVSKRNVAGVTVEGGANGPSFYWKFVEHGTVRIKARKYVAQSAEARQTEVMEVVASTLKEKLGF
jgi:phage protein, HK97 gp10 family